MKIVSQSVLQPCGISPLHGRSQRGDFVGALCSHPNLGLSAPFPSSSHSWRGGRGRNTLALMGIQIYLKPSGQLSFCSVREPRSAAIPITDKMYGPVQGDTAWFKLWGQTQPLSPNRPPWEDSNHPSRGITLTLNGQWPQSGGRSREATQSWPWQPSPIADPAPFSKQVLLLPQNSVAPLHPSNQKSCSDTHAPCFRTPRGPGLGWHRQYSPAKPDLLLSA